MKHETVFFVRQEASGRVRPKSSVFFSLARHSPAVFSWTRHSPAHLHDAHPRHAHPRRPVPALVRHGVGRARPRAHEERFRPRVRRAGAFAAEAMFDSSLGSTWARALEEVRVHAGRRVQRGERHRHHLETRSVDPEHVLLRAQEAVRDRAGGPRPGCAREGEARVLGGENARDDVRSRRRTVRGRDALSPKNDGEKTLTAPSLALRPQAAASNCSSHWTHHDIFLEGNYEVRLKDKDSTFVPNVGNLAPRPAKWSAARFKNQPGM